MKVFYKGQRGEGVYDVAFEGLIKNVERRYKETGSETMKAEYETFMNITPMFGMPRATSETGSFGGNRRRKKYCRSNVDVYRKIAKFS